MAGVHEGLTVADFGAGAGFFTRAAGRQVGDGGVVWAVDLNRELLSRIKNFAEAEGLTNVEVIHGDIESAHGTNLPEASFDMVIAANIFFTLENKGECLGEMHRILKKSGRALIIDWKDSFGGLGPHVDHVFTQTQAEKLLEQHGFAPLGKVLCGSYHWGLVVRKKSA